MGKQLQKKCQLHDWKKTLCNIRHIYNLLIFRRTYRKVNIIYSNDTSAMALL